MIDKSKINKLAKNPVVHQITLILIFLLINAKAVLNGGDAWFSDASRHAMNGVFIYDFIQKMPLTDPWQYTIDYYIRYPALSLGYHPPLFPLIEAIIFAIGGISFSSARITVMLFGIIGIICWYRLIVLLFDKKVAFFSTIFLYTTPLIITWVSIPMLELPALTMIILTIYTFFKYVEPGHRKHLYTFLICLGLSVMTKQTTIFLVPLIFLHLIITRNFTRQIKKEALIPIVIFAFLITVTIVMTVKFGQANIDQVMISSKSSGVNILPRFSLDNLLYYPRQLITILSIPVFILSLLALLFILIKKRTKSDIFFILWIVCAYLMMTFIGVKEPRYAFFLIPPVCLFATTLLFKVIIKKVNIGFLVAIILSIFQTVQAYQVKTPYIIGYEQAAKYVADHPKGFGILVNLSYDGNFIFHFRRHDENKKNIIFRSDKLFYKYRTKCIEHDALVQTLKDYGIKYIIAENIPRETFPQLEQITRCLNADDFIKRKEIKIESNLRRYQNSSILIYELKGEVKLNKDSLILEGWRFGRKVAVPLERLKN